MSPFFESIIEAVFNYNSYADKEIYPFAYYGNNKLIHIKDLPENFYEYREKINLNDKNLSDLYFYDRFLFAHFDNLALKAFYDEHPYHSTFNRYSLNYNKAKLDMIDSMISDDSIKNKLLKKKTRDFIITNTDESETTEMLNYFLVKSTNQDHKDEIQDLVLSLKALEKGNTIPNIAIVDIDGNEHDLAAVISNPTIIYFWTSNLKRQFRNSHYKAKELKEKFPEMDFISININDNNDRYWKKIIKQYDFPSTTEYRFKNSKEALQVLAVNIVNKAIVVDTNARILHSNTNIFRSEFGEILEGILQKKAL